VILNRMPDYLRVSLLSSCNLRCWYCMPADKHRHAITAPVDKVRVAIRFLYDFGIRKIRFTGGEPTLSGSLYELISFVKGVDENIHTAITSNGILLRTKAKSLAAAGLDSVNISIDTLDESKFYALTRSNCLDKVISGIDAAVEYIGNVKLNCVLINGINDDDIEKLALFANGRGLDIRFIEFMPNRYSVPGNPRFISGGSVRERLPWDLKALPVKFGSAARYYSATPLKIRLGFIDPVSHPFCNMCNRIRLTADGYLYSCLYDNRKINLFNLLPDNFAQARLEFKDLMHSKHYVSSLGTAISPETLPSFSAIGG
jgi:cyclic pyranopterin phosphate synthase